MPASSRQTAPATARNRGPILEVLRRALPERAYVLEISSGTGEHAAFFSRELPGLTWQPSDISPESLNSIEAWRSEGSEGLLSPILLDATSDPWPVKSAQSVVSINMIHIAPWEACEGLMRGAGRILTEAGLLLLYGPFRIDGRHTAPSNESFDRWLRESNTAWGVRDFRDVRAEAERAGLRFEERVAMPANNFSLIFRRS
jgi:cyclopropane fatty-acyl-phospholipid synthase-like methyltransferase